MRSGTRYLCAQLHSTFINGCLNSDCDDVNFVARHRVYFKRMLSGTGVGSLSVSCLSQADIPMLLTQFASLDV